MGSKRLKGPDRWELRVSVGKDHRGKYRYVSRIYRGTEAGARKALARLEVECADGKHSPATMTFGELLDTWLERATIEATTRNRYKGIVKKDLKPALGNVAIARLQPKDFDDLYAGLSAEGKKPRTVGQIHAVARVALNEAVRWGWIRDNPAQRAKPPKVRKFTPTPPTLAQLAQVVAADDDMATILLVAAALGGRRGELCGLRWCDLDGDRVRIHRAVVDVNGHLLEKDTKTHAERTFELDPITVARLDRLRADMRTRAADHGLELAPDAFVFSRDPAGRQPMRPEWVTKGYQRAAKAAGVKGTRLHDLRHLNISLLLKAGVPLAEVSYRAGHEKQSTTTDIYSHVLAGNDAEAPAILAQLLGPLSLSPLRPKEGA